MVFQDLQRRNHQCYAHAVIKSFGQVRFTVRQYLKIGPWYDRIPHLNAGCAYI